MVGNLYDPDIHKLYQYHTALSDLCLLLDMYFFLVVHLRAWLVRSPDTASLYVVSIIYLRPLTEDPEPLNQPDTKPEIRSENFSCCPALRVSLDLFSGALFSGVFSTDYDHH